MCNDAIERLVGGLKEAERDIRKKAALRLAAAAEAAGDWGRLSLRLLEESPDYLQAFARQAFRTGTSPMGLAAATVPALVEAIEEVADTPDPELLDALLDAMRAILRPVRRGADELLGHPRSSLDGGAIELLGEIGTLLAEAAPNCADSALRFWRVVRGLNDCLAIAPLAAHAAAALERLVHALTGLLRAGDATGAEEALAIVVIGKLGSRGREAVPTLVAIYGRAGHETRVGTRRNVVEALGKIGGQAALPLLTKALQDDPDGLVKECAAESIRLLRTGSEPDSLHVT